MNPSILSPAGGRDPLVKEVERRLWARGRRIIAVLVEDWNELSLRSFQRLGYFLDRSILYLSKREGPEV